MSQLFFFLLLSGCRMGSDEPTGLASLGGGTHSLETVEITTIATEEEELNDPRDVAFHPDDPQMLWVANQDTPSMTILFDVGTDDQEYDHREEEGGLHFLADVSSLDFGDNGFMATAQAEDEPTEFTMDAPASFMGPTLWLSGPDEFSGGWASHYDMLHNTPEGAGIAWVDENIYWVFDGNHSSLTYYDFAEDHGPAGEDHSDGIIYRYAEGEVEYIKGSVAHLAYDHDTQLLYAADTGNGRIAVLDTTSGELGAMMLPNWDLCTMNKMDDADIWTLVDSDDLGIDEPAGLQLYEGLLYVSDFDSGKIVAVDLDGNVIDWLDTERGAEALQGLALDEQGRIYVADSSTNEVLRISAAPVTDED